MIYEFNIGENFVLYDSKTMEGLVGDLSFTVEPDADVDNGDWVDLTGINFRDITGKCMEEERDLAWVADVLDYDLDDFLYEVREQSGEFTY